MCFRRIEGHEMRRHVASILAVKPSSIHPLFSLYSASSVAGWIPHCIHPIIVCLTRPPHGITDRPLYPLVRQYSLYSLTGTRFTHSPFCVLTRLAMLTVFITVQYTHVATAQCTHETRHTHCIHSPSSVLARLAALAHSTVLCTHKTHRFHQNWRCGC